jgi:hypothetical protein
MKWSDGSLYQGFWQNGIQNGPGILTLFNGKRHAGIFRENVLVHLFQDQNDLPT